MAHPHPRTNKDLFPPVVDTQNHARNKAKNSRDIPHSSVGSPGPAGPKKTHRNDPYPVD